MRRDRLCDQTSLVSCLYSKIKRPGCETDYSPISHAQTRNVWSNISHYSIRLHEVVLNLVSGKYTFTRGHSYGQEFKAYSGRQGNFCRLIPVVARSEAWVCGNSLAGVAGSHRAWGMNVCPLWVLSVVRWRPLRRADHSSRGVVPRVVCLNMISKPRKGGGPGLPGLSNHKKETHPVNDHKNRRRNHSLADVTAQRTEKASGRRRSRWKVCSCRNHRPTLKI